MQMKALLVDLTNRELEWATIREEAIAHYLGGRGLGVRYLYDNLAPGVDPLGPENILGMWSGPLMGSGGISMVKLCGVTKSPATGTILMSLMGGYFGPALRFSGADAVIFRGAADTPVYLVIDEGEAELRPADHLWGKTTRETSAVLEEELDLRRPEIASIGQAGENGVLFASIMHGGDAMGRGGIGAVMGSKNLKAIVANGRDRPKAAEPERFREIIKRMGKAYRESKPIEMFGVQGTTGNLDIYNLRRLFPTRNFREARFEHYERVNADALYDNHVTQRVTCYGCAVRCRREAEVKDGPYAGTHTEGPEYETLWGFGGNCGVDYVAATVAANAICQDYGMDTISASTTISFAMECFEEGLITEEDTGGLELTFGNHRAMIEMLPRIARREGIGDVLAQGSRRAAEIIGNGADWYAMEVKGLELAGYDPRGAKGMGLGYATSPRGACHERGYLTAETHGHPPGLDRYAYEGKGQIVADAQDTVAVKDSLSFCVLSSAGTSLDDMAEMYSAMTGIAYTADDLLHAGERICNLERLFNLREGFTREDDRLPSRFLKEAIPDPQGNLHTIDIERLLDDYYKARGWDSEGRPLETTLNGLDLGTGRDPGSPVLAGGGDTHP